MPRILEAHRSEHFDTAIMREMGELGLLGATIDGYGCAGVGYVSYGLVAREIERVDSGYRSAISVQSSLVMHPHSRLRQRSAAREVPAAARDRRDHRLLRTHRARRRLRPRLDGHPGARGRRRLPADGNEDLDQQRPGRRRLRGLGEERRGCHPRIHPRAKARRACPPRRIDGKFSLRASATGQISMDGVFVPAANELPNASGLKGPFGCLTRARYGSAWGALGAAEFCWHAAREYVLERRQFGRPLAANQLVQKKLADMQTEIAVGLAACLRLGRLFDEGAAPHEAVSMLKRNSAGKALDIARVARDMHGANGIADEYHVIRHLMNLETVNTYEGTHDVHALILGRGADGDRGVRRLATMDDPKQILVERDRHVARVVINRPKPPQRAFLRGLAEPCGRLRQPRRRPGGAGRRPDRRRRAGLLRRQRHLRVRGEALHPGADRDVRPCGFRTPARSSATSRSPSSRACVASPSAAASELMQLCDLQIAGAGARFAMTPARLGLGYRLHDVQLLVDRIGPRAAREMLFTGRLFDADEAERLGFVTRVVPDGDLDAAVDTCAAEIAANAPLSVRAIKVAIGEALKPPANRDHARCDAPAAACDRSEDYREGQRAFAERRSPEFRGR